MKALGIHKDPWHNTGACAISGEGEAYNIAFLSEERLDRVKDSRAFPQKSIEACMRQTGILDLSEIDTVVMDYIVSDKDWRLDQFRNPCSTENLLRGLEPERIHMIDHHLCHAYASFMTSPFEEAAILIVDGRGSRKQTQSLFVGSGNSIEFIEGTDTIGIGLLYATMTQHIGFGNLQEGKTMGLAPYGESAAPSKYDFEGIYEGISTSYERFCEDGRYDLLKEIATPSSFDERARAAYEVQQECERALIHLGKYAREVTGMSNICLSGGVALNSVANNALLKAGVFDDIFINPAASDTGIPLGAAYYGYYALGQNKRVPSEVSPYLGPQYSRQRIEAAIELFSGYRVVREAVMENAVEMLNANKIVARFEGRSEMGPRALGHRSILMSPLRAENKDVMNARVKFREEFRPFAPIVMEEFSQEYFDIDRPCPYMLLVPEVRAEKRKIIPAVTHVDGTARVQTVTESFNGQLYSILSAFHNKTDVPVLLNTSFNVAGEPIVETPEDAIKCFLGTDIDALYIDDVLLIKE